MPAYDTTRRVGKGAAARPCEQCETVFTPHYASVGRFCTARCGYDWRIALRGAQPCEACGDKFRPKRSNRTRYCGRACGNTAFTHARDGVEPPPVDGARWLPLSHGRFALIDADDFERTASRPWSYTVKDGTQEVTHSRNDGTPRQLHRFILGAPEGVIIDHRYGNRLDARRSNLRPATTQQNVQNQRKRRVATSSKYKGVHYASRQRGSKKWQAMIRCVGRTRFLGSFATETEAAHAYDAAAREQHGEFACVNFPLPGERSALVAVTFDV